MKKFLLCLGLLFLSFQCAFADYAFSVDERNITFVDDEFKFYENSTPLTKEQVQQLFPDYEIILISHFNFEKKYFMKNSVFKTRKVLLLNDTNRTFHGFEIYPTSSRVELKKGEKQGALKALINIYGKKNTRLKHQGGDEFEIVVK